MKIIRPMIQTQIKVMLQLLQKSKKTFKMMLTLQMIQLVRQMRPFQNQKKMKKIRLMIQTQIKVMLQLLQKSKKTFKMMLTLQMIQLVRKMRHFQNQIVELFVLIKIYLSASPMSAGKLFKQVLTLLGMMIIPLHMFGQA